MWFSTNLMRSIVNFDDLIRLKALQQKQLHHHGADFDLVDLITQQDPDQKHTRNICAHIPLPLFERVDDICSLLGLSKRQFVEQALYEAVDRTSAIVAEIKPFGDQELI